MTKLLLLSIIFATIALPAWAAKMKNPKLGLKRALTALVLFNLFYWFNLVFLFGRL